MTLTTEMLALREAAGRADQGEGQHIYTHPRDSNNYAANEAWHVAASPAAILALLAQLEAATSPKESALQALVDQAQELDMGYGASEQDKFMAHIREKYPNMSLDFMVRCDGAPVFNDAGTQARWAGWRDCSTITPTIGPRPRPPECQWCDKTDCRFPACKTEGQP